jgi:hypothetical protein
VLGDLAVDAEQHRLFLDGEIRAAYLVEQLLASAGDPEYGREKVAYKVRIVNWYLGLDLREKVVVWLAATVALFFAAYFGTLLVFSHLVEGEERSAPARANAPGVTYLETTRASSPEPDLAVTIASARCEGDKAVVEGSWKGDISSVHCDLLEGSGQYGRAMDCWDRGVPTVMSWSERTFSRRFVEDKGRWIEDPVHPGASYAVVCLAQFSGGWQISDAAAVEGTPPG